MQCTTTDIFLSKVNWMLEKNEKNLDHFFLSVSNTSLSPFLPLRFKTRSTWAPLYLLIYSDLIWNFVIVLVILFKTYTYKTQPAYTSKILISPTYSWDSTCLPVNPCSAQFLKCSSHWLPKCSVTVRTVLLNDQASHQQLYIILVCIFITAYHYTVMQNNMSKNPCKACLPLLLQIQWPNAIYFNT